MDYNKIYKEQVFDKISTVIVDYKKCNGKFCYEFKHHPIRESIAEEIFDLLINNVTFYAYNSKEIVDKFGNNNFDNLKTMAKNTFSERLARRHHANTDGLIGELLLDLIIQSIRPESKKLYTRAKYVQLSDNSEIKGYDAAYFLREENKIELWLGQSKAGQKDYCIKGISEDLNEKYLGKYFTGVIRYIVDRGQDEIKDATLLEIINEINKSIYTLSAEFSGEELKQKKEDSIIRLLINKKVSIIAPCLLAFDSDIYDSQEPFMEKLEKLSKSIFKSFEKKDFILNEKFQVKVIFVILPINQLNNIKEKVVEVKKEVQ